MSCLADAVEGVEQVFLALGVEVFDRADGQAVGLFALFIKALCAGVNVNAAVALVFGALCPQTKQVAFACAACAPNVQEGFVGAVEGVQQFGMACAEKGGKIGWVDDGGKGQDLLRPLVEGGGFGLGVHDLKGLWADGLLYGTAWVLS